MSSIKSPRPRFTGDAVQPMTEDAAQQMTESVAHTFTVGQYRLHYEVYGSGDRVLVWLNPLLFDSQLSRGLARALAAKGPVPRLLQCVCP